MIIYKTGDIFEEKTDAIVNTVNCVGVMGRGVALQFKKRFPENFKMYAIACKQNKVVPGKMFVHENHSLNQPKYIINFPTKRHWTETSRIEDIESGLIDLIQVTAKLHIKSIALPPLGCGLGKLTWDEVRIHIENKLSRLSDIEIIVFEPKGTPVAEKMMKNCKSPTMTPGRASLVELMHRYLAGLLDPCISLLEIHKLMYFLQESGEPLRLKYNKHIYGPYAENLRHVLHAIEGYLISGYADGGDQPNKELKLTHNAYTEASLFLQQHPQTKQHLDKVSDLVTGFESQFGMELLATVHWIATKENVKTIEDIITHVHQWNERKKQFTPRQIKLAYNVLKEKNWFC